MKETTVRLDSETNILLDMLVGIESRLEPTNKSRIARRLIINEADRMAITLPDDEGEAMKDVIKRAKAVTKKRMARKSNIKRAKTPHKLLDITIMRRI